MTSWNDTFMIIGIPEVSSGCDHDLAKHPEYITGFRTIGTVVKLLRTENILREFYVFELPVKIPREYSPYVLPVIYDVSFKQYYIFNNTKGVTRFLKLGSRFHTDTPSIYRKWIKICPKTFLSRDLYEIFQATAKDDPSIYLEGFEIIQQFSSFAYIFPQEKETDAASSLISLTKSNTIL